MATHRLRGELGKFGSKLCQLGLRLMMPKTRAAWEEAATSGVKELVFRAPPRANKIEIKQVLERLYGLEVANVNTLNREGKLKRSHYPLGRAKTLYRRADVKLAYVTLKELVKFPAPPLKEEPAAGKR